eukprot:scaffold208592_cov28-Tisochrysis_lutea.AAC.3
MRTPGNRASASPLPEGPASASMACGSNPARTIAPLVIPLGGQSVLLPSTISSHRSRETYFI